MYLDDAKPWSESFGNSLDVMGQIVSDQRRVVNQVGERVLELGGGVRHGTTYPMDFTDCHDLSFEFLLCKLSDEQSRLISGIDECVAELAGDPISQGLAVEALGLAKGHAELLEDLQRASLAS